MTVIRGHPLNDYTDEAGNPVHAIKRDEGTWALPEPEAVSGRLLGLLIAAISGAAVGFLIGLIAS